MRTTVDLDEDVHRESAPQNGADSRWVGWAPSGATVAPVGTLRYDRGTMKVSISYCKV